MQDAALCSLQVAAVGHSSLFTDIHFTSVAWLDVPPEHFA